MTNRPIALPAYPTTPDAAYRMLLDALRDASAETAAILSHDYDPLHEYRDHDDYLAAAHMITSAILNALSDPLDDNPLHILDELLADDEFRDDCDCADFSTPLFLLMPYPFD
jgi:hypothetical protein